MIKDGTNFIRIIRDKQDQRIAMYPIQQLDFYLFIVKYFTS